MTSDTLYETEVFFNFITPNQLFIHCLYLFNTALCSCSGIGRNLSQTCCILSATKSEHHKYLVTLPAELWQAITRRCTVIVSAKTLYDLNRTYIARDVIEGSHACPVCFFYSSNQLLHYNRKSVPTHCFVVSYVCPLENAIRRIGGCVAKLMTVYSYRLHPRSFLSF